ncbi:MAG: DUF2189 domain-containing protein [Rhodospirillaceae bacterium]|nr:DUF2189 domain-containing protein [Rhodospirillales bacterium]
MAGLEPLPAIRQVTVDRSTTWLERGFNDFRAHPGIGLAYGAVFAALGWLLTFGLAELGMGSLILPLAAGFMLVAPFLAIGLYEVSRRREAGEPVTMMQALGAVRTNGQMADMGLVLLLLFFAWFQVAMIIFALFFGGRPPAMDEFFTQILMAPQGIPFLMTGTIIGGVIAAIAFALSVVSIPMLLERKVSALTAMRTSLKAVWLNRMNMIGWAATLATLGFLGVSFLFIGLAVTLPIAAHASWHAYRDLVGE